MLITAQAAEAGAPVVVTEGVLASSVSDAVVAGFAAQAGAAAPRPFASPALYSGAFTYTFAPSEFVGSPPAADLTVSVYLGTTSCIRIAPAPDLNVTALAAAGATAINTTQLKLNSTTGEILPGQLNATTGGFLTGGNLTVALTLDPQLAYYVVSDAAGTAGAAAATRLSNFSQASASALQLEYGLSLCTYAGMEAAGGSPFTTSLLSSAAAVTSGAAAFSRVLEAVAGEALPSGEAVQAAAGGAAELRVQLCAADGRALDLGSATQAARLAVVSTPPLTDAAAPLLVYSGEGGVYYARVPVRAAGTFSLAVTLDGVALGGGGGGIALEVGLGRYCLPRQQSHC